MRHFMVGSYLIPSPCANSNRTLRLLHVPIRAMCTPSHVSLRRRGSSLSLYSSGRIRRANSRSATILLAFLSAFSMLLTANLFIRVSLMVVYIRGLGSPAIGSHGDSQPVGTDLQDPIGTAVILEFCSTMMNSSCPFVRDTSSSGIPALIIIEIGV